MAEFKIQEYANHVIIQEQDAYGRWWTISKRITLEEAKEILTKKSIYLKIIEHQYQHRYSCRLEI